MEQKVKLLALKYRGSKHWNPDEHSEVPSSQTKDAKGNVILKIN